MIPRSLALLLSAIAIGVAGQVSCSEEVLAPLPEPAPVDPMQ